MKSKLFIIIAAVILFPYFVAGQAEVATHFRDICDKYSTVKNAVSIKLSGELFKLILDDKIDSYVSVDDLGIKNLDFSKIKNVQLLHLTEIDDDKLLKINNVRFMDEVETIIKKNKDIYTKLAQIKTEDYRIDFLALKQAKEINELVVYYIDIEEQSVTLISIEGAFNEEMVNKALKTTATSTTF
jgi:hypothetical protein